MKNKLLEKIKQEYAEDKGHQTFLALCEDSSDNEVNRTTDKIAHRYAQEYAKQKLEEVREKVKSIEMEYQDSDTAYGMDCFHNGVDKSYSIIYKTIKEL